jgi:hypothetical protein
MNEAKGNHDVDLQKSETLGITFSQHCIADTWETENKYMPVTFSQPWLTETW